MKQKLVTLTKDAVLWETGDLARDVAVVDQGRLGVRTESGVVGIVLPRMILGESALFDGAQRLERRTATVFAIDEGTQVTAYSAADLRARLEGGDDAIGRQVLTTLLGQICRNFLMAISSRRDEPLFDAPLHKLIEGLLADAGRLPHYATWGRFMVAFTFLYDLRDLSDRVLADLGPNPSQRLEMVENASQALTRLGEGVDILPVVEAFLEAERAKADWWARP
jgi:CRP-like cAMP-binding protein